MDPPRSSALAFVERVTARNRPHHECVIWMPYFRRGNAFDAGKLAHEALHITTRLLKALDAGDEETHCYLLQWIVEETTWALRK